MPRVRIKHGKKAFVHGTLYREGGVLVVSPDEFNPKFMERVDDKVALTVRGDPRQKSPQQLKAADIAKAIRGEQAKEEPSDGDAQMLAAAVSQLNHGDDAHWTKDGKPNLNVVSEYAGTKVTREQLDAAYPELARRS